LTNDDCGEVLKGEEDFANGTASALPAGAAWSGPRLAKRSTVPAARTYGQPDRDADKLHCDADKLGPRPLGQYEVVVVRDFGSASGHLPTRNDMFRRISSAAGLSEAVAGASLPAPYLQMPDNLGYSG